MTMMRTFKLGLLLSTIALTSYTLGISFGAIGSKKTVSVYDLKQAISALVDDVSTLRSQINVLISDILNLKREVNTLKMHLQSPQEKYKFAVVSKSRVRVRLSPWGHIIGLVPRGTETVLFAKKGEWCLTNLGYIHCSLLEVKDGNQIR